MDKIKNLDVQSGKKDMEKEIDEISVDIIKKLKYLNTKYGIGYAFGITKEPTINSKYTSALGGSTSHLLLLQKVIEIQAEYQILQDLKK